MDKTFEECEEFFQTKVMEIGTQLMEKSMKIANEITESLIQFIKSDEFNQAITKVNEITAKAIKEYQFDMEY